MSIKSTTRLTIDIPTTDHQRLKILAASHGKTMKSLILELIEQGLERYGTIDNARKKKNRTLGALKGKIKIKEDFDTLPDEFMRKL